MKEIVLPVPEHSAKAFLMREIPVILKACNIEPRQRIWGFQVNLVNEALKRVDLMSEADAKAALTTLIEELKKYG